MGGRGEARAVSILGFVGKYSDLHAICINFSSRAHKIINVASTHVKQAHVLVCEF